MASDVVADFRRFLDERLEAIVESRFDDFLDEEDAFAQWRRDGLDPGLKLPRPALADSSEWRCCVGWESGQALCNELTLLVAGMTWGSLGPSQVECKPSLGESEDEWGLVGSWSLMLGKYPDGFRLTLLGNVTPAVPT